ncbi:response regulator [Staphylococcus gallinarum]|nr:response regulator [Staphylococcus gallinarum]
MPTCLIVDDDTQILDYVAKHVKNESIDTAIHVNAESALKYLEHNQVDIAIVDIMMDGMNGF